MRKFIVIVAVIFAVVAISIDSAEAKKVKYGPVTEFSWKKPPSGTAYIHPGWQFVLPKCATKVETYFYKAKKGTYYKLRKIKAVDPHSYFLTTANGLDDHAYIVYGKTTILITGSSIRLYWWGCEFEYDDGVNQYGLRYDDPPPHTVTPQQVP